MKKKILTFIVRREKLLVLYSEPHPEHGEGGWFVVTGGVENEESYEETVAREVMEETGLAVKKSVFLNWGSIYEWRGEVCEEHNFISFVKEREIVLNEEHSRYEWLDFDEFIERVRWGDDKELLKKVLIKAMTGEKYFKKLEIKDYRGENGFTQKKRKGGWQANVEYFKNYVVKTPKTEEEIRKHVAIYLNHVGKIEELEKRVKNMQDDWVFSLDLIFRKNIPLKMLGYPEFLENGKIKQKRVLVLQDVFEELFSKGDIKRLETVIKKTLKFIIELWKYGIHEKTFKIGYEFGLMDDKIILIDFGELSDDKNIVEKQIEKKSWEKNISKYCSSDVSETFNKIASDYLTLDILTKNWRINDIFLQQKQK